MDNIGIALSRRSIYPHIEEFFEDVLNEVDHAIEKRPSTNATQLSLPGGIEIMLRELREAFDEIDAVVPNTRKVFVRDVDNLKRELCQVAGVAMMLYCNLENTVEPRPDVL